MGLHVAHYEKKGMKAWAVVKNGTLQHIPGDFASLADFLAEADPGAASEKSIPLSEVRLLSPVTAPCSVVCQGLNYSSHRKEAGRDVEKPPFNMIFMKAHSSLSGPNDDVIRPKGVRLLDYELELGIVIRKPIEAPLKVTNENLHEYVAGVVITNDVSARDVQVPQQQWFKGKSFRTFCPTGPFLYLIDKGDVPKILNLDIKLEVNGQTRQQANTSQLLYGPAETLTELSGLMNLYPGDLVQTGTPGGVAIKAPSARAQRIGRILMDEKKMLQTFLKRQLENPNYLKDGDVMRLTMRTADGTVDLGVMETRVVAAS